MTWLALLLAIGATVRLTRLVTTDDFPPTVWLRTTVLVWAIGRVTRGQVAEHADAQHASDHPAYKLLTCPWCCSFWIGLAALAAAHWAGHSPWYLIAAGALTASHAAGLAAGVDA